ncbi:hypothetical protein Leryth_005790 [Lithospermum erythrorhizon]|nr:hypothetical protein Leryth_005790 [Lithospermum erythrorhizon]
MGNELGNQNSTETKGEEDEAIQGKENFQPAKDGIKGENHIIPEGESKDYHHKADLPACLSPDPEVPETVETELDDEEPQNLDKVLEGHMQEEESPGQDYPTVQMDAQRDEHNSETCLQNGGVGTKVDDIKVPEKKPILTEKDEEFETHESNIISRQEPEGESDSSERESEGIQEMSSTGNIEETVLQMDTGHCVNSLTENEDFHGKWKGDDTEQETIFTSNYHEKYDDSIDDIAGGNNIGTEENGDFLPLVKLTDSTESKLENEKPEALIDHGKLTNHEPAFAERKNEIEEIEKVAYSVPITESSQVADEGGKEVEINSNEVENEAFSTENVTVGDRIPKEQIPQSQLYGEGNILIVTGEELELKHQIPLKIPSENDIIPEMPNSQFGNGEMNAFESSISEVPEINGRSSIQSNQELPCNRIELTKCPSFDFGIPLDARCEESDQTPFLQPHKSLFRSLSISSKTANDRHSLDYESIVVREKKIRVERSDSCHSSAPLHSIMKEETNNAEIFSQKNKSNDSNMKGEDDSGRSMKVELESSSPFNAGSRKTRSSFFSTCLCCSTAIN